MFVLEGELHVVVAMPGVAAEAIDVQLSTSGLLVRAASQSAATRARARIVRLEIPYGRIERRIELPPGHYELLDTRAAQWLPAHPAARRVAMSDANDQTLAGAAGAVPAKEPQAAEAAADDNVLIILPVRNTVLFPQVVLPIAIRRERSIAAAQEAVKSQRKVGLLLQRDPDQDDPQSGGPAPRRHGGEHRALCHRAGRQPSSDLSGRAALQCLDFISREPFLVARIELHPEPTTVNPEIEARGAAAARAGDRGAAAAAAGAGGARDRDAEHRIVSDAGRT